MVKEGMEPVIVNIINFIRGAEPRDPHIDLHQTVRRQMQYISKHNLPATWLIAV